MTIKEAVQSVNTMEEFIELYEQLLTTGLGNGIVMDAMIDSITHDRFIELEKDFNKRYQLGLTKFN